MHGLNRPVTRQLPPVAERRPSFSVQHGLELVDEYAWLRAANWQDVMRDPSVLDPQIRAYLDAENAYTECSAQRHQRPAEVAVCGDEGAHQGRRQLRPHPGWALRIFHEPCHRRPVPAIEPASARRRPRAGAHRRQQGGRGQALLAARIGGAQPRPPLSGLRRRRQGFGAVHHSHPRYGDRPGPARLHSRYAQRCRMGPRQPHAVLCPSRRQPSPPVRLPAPARDANVGRCAGLRGKGHRLLCRRRPDAIGQVHHRRCPRPPDQ